MSGVPILKETRAFEDGKATNSEQEDLSHQRGAGSGSWNQES